MKKALKQLPLLLAMISILILPYFVFAESPLERLESVAAGENGPYQTADKTTLATNVGLIVNTAFGLLGALFIILIILAGFNWMTAEGNDEKISKAKDKLKSAIIGLIIILASYSIWKLVAEKLIFG
jgi:hypothetical protein